MPIATLEDVDAACAELDTHAVKAKRVSVRCSRANAEALHLERYGFPLDPDRGAFYLDPRTRVEVSSRRPFVPGSLDEDPE